MKEYPKLVLNRNYVLATTMGHSISFVKGEATHVPPLAFAEAIAIGAQPVDGSDPEHPGNEARRCRTYWSVGTECVDPGCY